MRLNGNRGFEQTSGRTACQAGGFGCRPVVTTARRWERLVDNESRDRGPAMQTGETLGAEVEIIHGPGLVVGLVTGLLGTGGRGMLTGERGRHELQQQATHEQQLEQ